MKNSRIFITYKRLSSAILSKNKAAYLGMLVIFLRPFTLLFDKLFSEKISEQEIQDYNIPPCVIMVSPSRSGSTIIYQALTRMLPCIYISNLHSLFPRNASSYMLKKNLFGKTSTLPQNYYGYTSSFTDVCEGNELLSQITKGNPSTDEIRRRFIEFMIYMGANKENPLIIKNVQSYDKILKLHKAIPELLFLRISRNKEQVSQSMLKAYYELGYFHYTKNANLSEVKTNPALFSVKHLNDIEYILNNHFAKIDKDVIINWTYESFCDRSIDLITDLAKNKLAIHPNTEKLKKLGLTLSTSKRKKVSDKEEEIIKIALNSRND